MKTNLLISTKMALLVMFFLLPVMEFTGFGAWAQSVVITTTNNKCLNGGIVNVGSTTGLGATPEFQVFKDGVLVFPDPGNSALFSTATSFKGLVDGNYVVVGRAGPGNPTYSSNSIAVDDGYVNFVASTSIVSASCVGGTAVLTTNVTSGGVKPLTFSIASASSPGVPLQTASGINANSFSFNALPVGNYTVSVTDSCGQTIVGATSVSAVSTTLADVKLPSSTFTRANLTCSNPFIIYNQFGFTYVAGGAPLTGAAAALFSVHILYNGVLYGKDNTGDGYADAGAPGWAANSAISLQMPLGITRANILANLGNIKVVLMDACGNTKEFTVTNPLYSIDVSNCGGVAYATSTIYSGLVCLPMNITFTNTSNPSDVVTFTQTTGTQTFTGGLTPGQTYSYTYLDSEGYSTGIFYLPQTKTVPTSSSTSVTQNFYGNQFNLNVLNYGRLLIYYRPFVVGDIIYYTVTASNNPLVPVGHTGSVALDKNGNAYLPRVNATDPAGYWPEGNYTITVNGNCGSSSANFVVSGYTASSFDNLITPVCGGFNYQLTGVFDDYNAYQVVVISGPSSVGEVRNLSNATTSQPFNGLTYGNYVFGVRIKGGTSYIHTRFVSITADNFITVDKTVTGGYVCNSGDTNGVLSITASSIAPAPGNVLQYALSPDGGSTYGPYQSGSTFSGLSGGKHYFRVKDACGNIITQTAQLGVAGNPKIAVNGVYGNASVCNYTGATVTLTLDVDFPSSTYLWSGPGINATNNNVKNPVVNVSAMSSGANVYSCTFNSGPPCNTSGTASVTIDSRPFVDLVVTDPAPVCFPSTVDLTAAAVTASSTGVFTKTYWKDAACTIPLTPANAVNISGTYYIKGIADATLNLCETIRPVVVVINPLPIATISYPGGPFCPTGTAAVTVSGASGGTFTSDAGLSINASTGVINLAASTSGNHTVTYNFTSAGCSSTTTTVVNVKNPIQCAVVTVIDAVNDTPSVVNGTTGATVPTVFANDTLNGVAFVPTDVTLTSLPLPAGLTLNSDGTITVAPGTASGTYPVTYTICQVANPTVCDTAISSVVVTTIDAVNDTPSVVNGTTGATVPTVFANDTLNGVAFVPTDVTLTSLPLPAGLTLNSDGTITVAPGTASGTYPVTYTICQVANPTVCDTAISSVVVTTIDAVNDTPSVVNGTTGATVPTVFANDTLNGVAFVPTDVTLTSLPLPAGLTLNSDGTITVAPGTASGTYPVTYTICQVANPTVCDTAVTTIVVATIDAINDTPTPINGTPGGSTPSVLANDTLDGSPLNPTDTTLTPVSVPAGLTLNPDGTITVDSNTPAGTYPVVYEICQVANPTVCDTATATVVVDNPIVANDDTIASTGGNVLSNDTLNGAAVTTTNTDVTPVTSGPLSIDADGTLTVAPNTPSGTYTITYQLCEVGATPANCDTAIATVVVDNPIVANDDTIASTGGNVLSNDTLNGAAVTTTNTDVTPVTSGPLSIDANGTLTVAPNTASGTYTITYELCEVGATPANCDTAIATVVVGNPIVANDDTIASTGGNVLSNDTLNGAAVTTTNTDVTPVTSGPLSIDANGTLTVAPNTASGTYTITYELCEVGATPANCDTAIATVVVDNPIVANDDSVGPIVSSTSVTTNVINVLANDTFNGNPLVLADVNLTVVNPNPNLRLNADGSVDVLGNTPEGTYVLVYQICEKTNPANCKTATVTVTVVAPVIVATNDDYSNQPIDSSKGTVLDILANDRLNNGTVSAPQVVITIVDANGIAGVTVDAQGKVTIPTGTPVGTYVITYRICDVVNPNNCATATITIVVKDPCDFDDSASSCDILVHNAFSPNNDGRNEVFLIERIENYPDNTVEIYNRWGVLVFEVSGYDNASKVFVGLSEGRVTVNKADALPNGTYYYVVKYKKPISGVMNQKAGFLYLSR